MDLSVDTDLSILLLLPQPPLAVVVTLVVIDVIVSAVAALLAYGLLPDSYRQAAGHALLFFFSFGLFVPVLGAIGVIGLAAFSRRYARPRPSETYQVVELPEFSEGRTRIQHSYGIGGLQARLRNRTLPTELRMRALLAVQDAPVRLSSPVMHTLLGDPIDDVRLLAYGLLSNKEKVLNERIHVALGGLGKVSNARNRVAYQKTLAGLYWELAYQGLVRGELLQHALSEARHYALEALAIDSHGALWSLLGKIYLRQGRLDKAEAAFREALKLDFPMTRVAPYLAEVAFLKRDFGEVRRLLCQVSRAERTEEFDLLVRYWCEEGMR